MFKSKKSRVILCCIFLFITVNVLLVVIGHKIQDVLEGWGILLGGLLFGRLIIEILHWIDKGE